MLHARQGGSGRGHHWRRQRDRALRDRAVGCEHARDAIPNACPTRRPAPCGRCSMTRRYRPPGPQIDARHRTRASSDARAAAAATRDIHPECQPFRDGIKIRSATPERWQEHDGVSAPLCQNPGSTFPRETIVGVDDRVSSPSLQPTRDLCRITLLRALMVFAPSSAKACMADTPQGAEERYATRSRVG